MKSALALLAVLPLVLQDQDLPKSTMKAVRMHAYGKPEVLVIEDVPLPVPKAGEVLVRVHAAGVNPIDLKTRAGLLGKDKKRLPLVLGCEIAGTVSRLGPDVKSLAFGDAVYGLLPLERMGGYAEFVALPAEDLVKKPAALDFEKAAAVPLPALTAYQALVGLADVQPGQTVLVHARADLVAFYAIQFAKLKGAKVIVSATSESALGHLKTIYFPDESFIDRDTQEFAALVKDADVVLDSLGGEMQSRSYACLKKGGFLVSLVQAPDPGRLKALGVRGALVQPKPDPKALGEITQWIEAGKLLLPPCTGIPLRFLQATHKEEGFLPLAKSVLVFAP